MTTWTEREFLGMEFTVMGADEALAAIVARASRLERFAYVTTPNVDHVVSFSRDRARAPLYREAWLRLNDSRVLEILAKAAGHALPAAPGADLVERLFEEEISPHEPVTIIGGDEAAIAALSARYGLTNVRWFSPPQGMKNKPAAVAEAAAFVAAQRARFVFICVGAPQQEMVGWAASLCAEAVGVGLCVGASLDFLAGRTRRAPYWMRRARLEWAFRLAAEPRRLWRRYLVEGPRVFALWARWTRDQRARASMAARVAA
ncbi:MAG: WecB/TagA/CpsF family glycosyltransferase [Hyphomonadaceae bacterium]